MDFQRLDAIVRTCRNNEKRMIGVVKGELSHNDVIIHGTASVADSRHVLHAAQWH
jgi:hypothetical protein